MRLVRYHRTSCDSKLSLTTTTQAYGKMASRFYCFGPGRERPEPLEQRARFRSSFVHRLNAEFMRDLVARITLSVFIVAGTVNFNCSWQPVAQLAKYRCCNLLFSPLFRSFGNALHRAVDLMRGLEKAGNFNSSSAMINNSTNRKRTDQPFSVDLIRKTIPFILKERDTDLIKLPALLRRTSSSTKLYGFGRMVLTNGRNFLSRYRKKQLLY